MIIYSDIMIAQQSTSNLSCDPQKRSHLSVGRNHNKNSKYNNQQRWRWNNGMFPGEKQ